MNKRERTFVDTVWEHYRTHGRNELPWRRRITPYRVLVSELMLQQTQVSRVEPKFREFVKRWPSAAALAAAPLGDVLRAWQGLGYNRRAKYLHEAAKVVNEVHRDRFPRTERELRALPGVGAYTAGAIMAFAYNQPVVLIETNVRTVYLHHYCKGRTDVADTELLPLIERTLDRTEPREWYYALMDYGSFIKRTQGNHNRRSRHYTKQTPFEGSDRQLRGAILRVLHRSDYTHRALIAAVSLEVSLELSLEIPRVERSLHDLETEGLVLRVGGHYTLP